MKKVKFFFIEYVPASNALDDFDEVARFAPDMIKNAREVLKNLQNNSRGGPFSYYLGAVLDQCQKLILSPNFDQLGYYPGCLLDNYLLYNDDTCTYIIIQEKYLNEWSSTLMATKTNDRKLVDDFFKTQDEVLNEINAE